MNSKTFREELVKIMPGYTWTVHQSSVPERLAATGVQSSGSNRLSTLSVTRDERNGPLIYEAKSAGYGLRAPWLHKHSDRTLARALRGLQDHYEAVANQYRKHAMDLKHARAAAQSLDAQEHQTDAVDSTEHDEIVAPGMSA